MSDPRLNDIERRLDRLETLALDATNQIRMQRERIDKSDETARRLDTQLTYYGRILTGDPGTATEGLPAQMKRLAAEMEILGDAIRALREQPSTAVTPRQFAVGVALILAVVVTLYVAGGV